MSILGNKLQYEPSSLNNWCNAMVGYLTDGSNTKSTAGGLQTQCNAFKTKVEEMATSGKFKGPVAETHYKAMSNVYNSLAKFLNQLCLDFSSEMTSFGEVLSAIEAASALDAIAELTISIPDIQKLDDAFTASSSSSSARTYDAATYANAVTEFNKMVTDVTSVLDGLETEVGKIATLNGEISSDNNEQYVLEGTFAASLNERLTTSIATAGKEVKTNIEIASSNMRQLKENFFGE